MMDLQGPEVRTSYLIDQATRQRIDKLELKTGDSVVLYGTSDLSEVRGCGYCGTYTVVVG